VTAESASAHEPGSVVPTARPSRGTRATVLSILVVAAIVLAVFAVVQHNRLSDARGLDRARNAAQNAANTKMPQLVSYSYKTIDKDIATAKADVTGSFADQYNTLVTQQIRPGVLQQQVVATTKSAGSSVISASRNQVEVLVFLVQTTTRKSLTAPETLSSAARVTMTKEKNAWLISNFATVPSS
jgi:Mce-associated membrane protein